MSLRENIQRLINEKGISVAKLSRLADIHQDTLYNFLNGSTEMTAANLDKVFEVLNGIHADVNPAVEPKISKLEQQSQENSPN